MEVNVGITLEGKKVLLFGEEWGKDMIFWPKFRPFFQDEGFFIVNVETELCCEQSPAPGRQDRPE